MRLHLIAVFALVLSSAAYAKKFPLIAAATVPAAKGEVNTDSDKNHNTEVKINVDFLAEPASLTPPQSVYVIWFQERGGQPESQGQLRVDKKLKGNFKTVTTLKTFDVFITGESDPNVKAPTGPEVLRATIQP